jgi:hypothetical protein
MQTAFPTPGGWSIWVREPEGVRHFIVAITKEAHAWEAVRMKVPIGQLLSSEPLTRDLVLSLGVAQGYIKERISRANAGSPAFKGTAGFVVASITNMEVRKRTIS